MTQSTRSDDSWLGSRDVVVDDSPGGTVRPPARRTVVFGGRERGRELSRRLATRGPVCFVDSSRPVVDRAAREVDAVHVDGFGDATAIAAAGVTPDDRVVVATGRDSTNLLLAQVLRSTYGVERLTVLVEDPSKHTAFDALGVQLVCVTDLLATTLVDRLDRPDRQSVDASEVETGLD